MAAAALLVLAARSQQADTAIVAAGALPLLKEAWDKAPVDQSLHAIIATALTQLADRSQHMTDAMVTSGACL